MPQAGPHGSSTDPYRIFFPLGILMGVAGVAIWPLYHFGVTEGYSSRAHIFVQTDCFLYAFVVGFLWTAIPRFTGTSTPSRAVQYVLAAFLLLAAVSFEAEAFAWGHLVFLAAHVLFCIVAAQRFLRRKTSPPQTFALVGAGIVAGMLGAAINLGVAWEAIAPGWDAAGKRLLTEGMVLLLVLGIGGFLGPRLLGFAQLPDFQALGKLSNQIRPPFMVRHGVKLYGTAGILILGSVFFEYGFEREALAWLRAALGTLIVAATLHPWRWPSTRTTLAWCVWTANWLLIVALWAVAAVPRYRVDFLHILFMGTFALMILAVGTRVVLSHGGHALTEERRSWPLRIGLATGLIALLARVGAPFVPASYFSHLAWAALFWMGGMLFWGIYLFRRIRR